MTTIFDVPDTNPPNLFSQFIKPLLILSNDSSSSAPTLDETAVDIANAVNNSPDPVHELWQLWDAFFIAVATNSKSQTALLDLLDALRAQSPMQPQNARAKSIARRHPRVYAQADGKLHWSPLPCFSDQWRDVHDILQAWRDWDGVRPSSKGDNTTTSTLSGSADEYYLRFCTFSAMLVERTQGKAEVHPIWVFLACRDVLEREQSPLCEPKAHKISQEQVWVLDVRVAATWVRDAGRALWKMDTEELRRHWAAALDEKTELWPKENGLTQERWRLWGKQLQALGSEDGALDEQSRFLVKEAADVVRNIST